MAPNVPEKQWAQVIEKTGGPVDYKEIPGEISGSLTVHYHAYTSQSPNRVLTKCLSISSILESATPICMPSTVTGHCQQSSLSSEVTKVLVSLWRRVT